MRVISLELAAEIERGLLLREWSATLRHEAEAARELSKAARAGIQPYPRRKTFCLLTIAESLIEAHKLAVADQDGLTIDLIQDALTHVGKRLVEETDATGPAARTITGYYRQEPEGGDDCDRSVPERR